MGWGDVIVKTTDGSSGSQNTEALTACFPIACERTLPSSKPALRSGPPLWERGERGDLGHGFRFLPVDGSSLNHPNHQSCFLTRVVAMGNSIIQPLFDPEKKIPPSPPLSNDGDEWEDPTITRTITQRTIFFNL